MVGYILETTKIAETIIMQFLLGLNVYVHIMICRWRKLQVSGYWIAQPIIKSTKAVHIQANTFVIGAYPSKHVHLHEIFHKKSTCY